MSLNNNGNSQKECLKAQEKSIVILGICAMHKKSHSPPMHAILQRIAISKLVEIRIFDEGVILNRPIEEWPFCDVFLAFFSAGFPLEKALGYADKYQPFVINDLKMQFTLLDRVQVYQVLEEAGIEIPDHVVLRRDGTKSEEELGLTEEADSIEINGVTFQKPFVEKPVDAEDHNVHIYYPVSAGGGQTQLFRKVKDRSSIFVNDYKIRRTGSYIYEEFIRTNGADVKVYSIGPDYAHAEARKCPSLDGKVERDQNGKEVRFPVLLTAKEKLIAKTISMAFKQYVCGFDLLRTKGKMYVCDVNGFSFVKSSPKYFDDASALLVSMILENQAPYLIQDIPRSVVGGAFPQDLPIAHQRSFVSRKSFNYSTISTLNDELRCVIGVIRHGDRNPKQKSKFVISHPRFTELFSKYNKKNQDSIKLKKPKQLQEFLDLIKEVLDSQKEQIIPSWIKKLNQMKSALEMYGKFSGINRKLQMKRHQTNDQHVTEPSFLLILKWGGELTRKGMIQAEDLGRSFRLRYPDHESYGAIPGSGFLRLHSTYRHDLKIYASDEGRVQMTAAAFAKGLLELEGSLSSILVHLVKCDDDSTSLLDTSCDANAYMAKAKIRLQKVMKMNQDFNEKMIDELAATRSPSLLAALKKIKNPYVKCMKVYQLVKSLVKYLEESNNNLESDILDLIIPRWKGLEKDFYDIKTDTFDISKIPDIYDCVKYDIIHNKKYLHNDVLKIHNKVKTLADVVIPQEYGITVDEKLVIAQKICKPLLNKIISDFLHIENNSYAEQECFHLLNPSFTTDVESPKRHVRTRLYFTSESHVHSLFNIMKYGGLWSEKDPEWEKARIKLEQISELSYNTQIIFHIYEDSRLLETDPDSFYVVVYFSPGMKSIDDLRGKGMHGIRTKDGSAKSLDKLATCKSYSNSPESHFVRHDWGSADNLTDLCYSLDRSTKRRMRACLVWYRTLGQWLSVHSNGEMSLTVFSGPSDFETETIHPKMFKSLEIGEEGCSEQSRFKPRNFSDLDDATDDIMPASELPFKVGTASLKRVKNLIYQMTESTQ